MPSMKGAGERMLRFGLQFCFMAMNEPDEEDASSDCADENSDADGLREAFHLFAEQIREGPITTGPDDRAGGVKNQESRPRHAVHTGEDRRQGAEHGDEPPK